LENRRKITIESPRNAFKRKNKAKEGEVLGLRVKKEQESTKTQAQKMLRGRMALSTMPTLV
jgi:hypothetical protein